MTGITNISRRRLFALAALSGAAVAAAPGIASAAPQTWDEDGWTHVPALSDDFDSAASEDNWEKGLWYPGARNVQRFRDHSVIFDTEGELLRLRAQEGSTSDAAYDFGAVESYFDIPGVATYTEVRARMLDSRARVLSAIWQQSSNHDHVDRLLEGANPNPEIDVQELFHPDAMDMALHTWKDGNEAGHIAYGGRTYRDPSTGDLSEDFHTYGIERRDGRLRFYLDRKLAWDREAPHPSLARMSRHQVLSLEAHLGWPNPDYLPSDFEIDYVHVYYHTAVERPETGTYRIINPAERVMLDIDGDALALTSNLARRDRRWWDITETNDFTFTVDVKTGAPRKVTLALTLEGGAGQPDVPVALTTETSRGTDSKGSLQRWHIRREADGLFSLRSKFSGLALSIVDGELLQQEYTGDSGQLWSLENYKDRKRSDTAPHGH